MRRIRLGDHVTKIGSGATPRGGKAVYTDRGVALIRSQNVLDHSMRIDGIARISDSDARALDGVSVEPDDVLLNITGDSIARCAVVDPAVLPARVNQHVAIIRADGSLNPRFIQRILASPLQKQHLLALSQGGATRKALTKSMIANLELTVPELEVQEAIAEVLGALDDKIAANERLVTTADDLSTAGFESAITDGPEVPLSSLARFVNGKAFTKDATGYGRVVVRIAELNSGVGGSTVYNDIEVSDDHLARPGDLLFAWSGSLTVKRWFRSEAIVNQHIFKVVPMSMPMWVVKGALDRKLSDFRSIAADKATTMGHIQRRHLDEVVRVPPLDAIGARDELMTQLWTRALSSETESLRLIDLRDTLLPALMSGRLTVKDAERTVSEVV